MQEIKQWLNSKKRDYHQGIAILSNIDPKMALKLSNGPNRPDQLFNALRNHIGEPVAKSITKAEPVFIKEATIPVEQIAKPSYNGINETAAAQLRVAQKLFKEMSNKRALLFKLCPAKHTRFENEGGAIAERGALTQEVMNLRYQVDEAYAAYNFALENNRLPETIIADQVPPEDLHRQISNCRKYISKLKNIMGPSPAQAKKLVDKEAELWHLLKAYNS